MIFTPTLMGGVSFNKGLMGWGNEVGFNEGLTGLETWSFNENLARPKTNGEF